MAVTPAQLASLAPTGCNISVDAQVLGSGLNQVLNAWDTASGSITIRNAAAISAINVKKIAQVFTHRVHFEF